MPKSETPSNCFFFVIFNFLKTLTHARSPGNFSRNSGNCWSLQTSFPMNLEKLAATFPRHFSGCISFAEFLVTRWVNSRLSNTVYSWSLTADFKYRGTYSLDNSFAKIAATQMLTDMSAWGTTSNVHVFRRIDASDRSLSGGLPNNWNRLCQSNR